LPKLALRAASGAKLPETTRALSFEGFWPAAKPLDATDPPKVFGAGALPAELEGLDAAEALASCLAFIAANTLGFI
jgi:hypothetical protein